MNNFIVPQFIDVEDRIIGPITIRQFLVCTVGSLFVFIAYKLSDFGLFVFQLAFIGPITILFAFIRVNGKGFHNFIIDVIIYLFKVPRFAVWQKKEYVPVKAKKEDVIKDPYIFIPKDLPRTRLSEISLLIDTGGAYVGENEDDINYTNFNAEGKKPEANIK